jgi:hypothetical protein
MNMSGVYIPKPVRRVDKAVWSQMSKALLRAQLGAISKLCDFRNKSGQLLLWLLHLVLPPFIPLLSLRLLLRQQLDTRKINPAPLVELVG